jgi:hypothetical protein
MAVKRLLRQSLSADEEIIDVHPLASLILEEGVRLTAGSSIKTDGEESDPWGLVGVVDVVNHRVSYKSIRLHVPGMFANGLSWNEREINVAAEFRAHMPTQGLTTSRSLDTTRCCPICRRIWAQTDIRTTQLSSHSSPT